MKILSALNRFIGCFSSTESLPYNEDKAVYPALHFALETDFQICWSGLASLEATLKNLSSQLNERRSRNKKIEMTKT